MRQTRPLDHIRAISPWFTKQEAAEYLKMDVTSFSNIAPQIGGRKPPCFVRELRYHRQDLDNFMLKLPKLA